MLFRRSSEWGLSGGISLNIGTWRQPQRVTLTRSTLHHFLLLLGFEESWNAKARRAVVAEEWEHRDHILSGVVHPFSLQTTYLWKKSLLSWAAAMEGATSYLPMERTEIWKDAKKREQNTQRKKRGSGIQKEKKRRRITQQEKWLFEKKKKFRK